MTKLVVWDTQTGVTITEAHVWDSGRIMFHGDHKTITFVSVHHHYTYDALSGIELCKGDIELCKGDIQTASLGAFWTHKDALCFATGFMKDENSVINIYELQPTSATPLHVLSSFSVPYPFRRFSFSPVAFHASFVTNTGVIIYDVQTSKLLLDIEASWKYTSAQREFSPDGHFFACRTSEDEICVWLSTPTGYMPWSSLRSRLPLNGFTWSPSSDSILCWGSKGVQLLHPGNHPSPFPPNIVKPHHRLGDHLVAYSVDKTHIATTQQGDNNITVLNLLSSPSHQSICMEMEIQDIKVIGDTIFVLDEHKLVNWDLKTFGTVDSDHKTGMVTVSETLAIGPQAEHLTLSHDCSQVAFARDNQLFLYDIKTQNMIYQDIGRQTNGLRFSLDGCKLWPIRPADTYYLKGMEHVWDWGSGEVIKMDSEGMQSLFYPPSPHGYHTGVYSGWVEDSRGSKILWLPPNWRAEGQRWDGNFLALVGGHLPQPIIIKFEP